MNKQLTYRIESMYDREGNKIVNERRQAREYIVGSMLIGSSAILVNANRLEEFLKTSTVEDIFIQENTIKLVTKNTEYWLTPFVKDAE